MTKYGVILKTTSQCSDLYLDMSDKSKQKITAIIQSNSVRHSFTITILSLKCSSVVESLPSLYKGLGLILSTKINKIAVATTTKPPDFPYNKTVVLRQASVSNTSMQNQFYPKPKGAKQLLKIFGEISKHDIQF